MERNGSKRAYREIGTAAKAGRTGPNRIGEAWSAESPRLFSDPVEVDETCIGGRRKNMPKAERAALSGHGGVGKSIVAGTKGRAAERFMTAMVEPGDPMSGSPAGDLAEYLNDRKFGTVLADPPWRFANRTGKVAPEHRRLSRYGTLTVEEIAALPVGDFMEERAHCYLWVPNALLPYGLLALESWGFEYKSNLIWHKIRKDGGSDGRGVGFYFRNVTEMVLFGIRGKNARTLPPGRRQVNLIASRKREHSRKPDEQYELIESCSWGPYLELFGRGLRDKWTVWGNQAEAGYEPDWPTYSHNSAVTAP